MAVAKCTIEGIVGQDPELKFSKGGTSYARFSVAVTDRKKNGSGDWEDGDTTWYSITAFKWMADQVYENIDKGDMVLIDGRMKLETWESDEGTRSKIAVTAERVGLISKKGSSKGSKVDRDSAPY